jgi:hypothetical protein
VTILQPYEAILEILGPKTHRYMLAMSGRRLSFAQVLDLWQHDIAFSKYFTSTLVDSRFHAFRWETPPINQANKSRKFEFTLLDEPRLARRPDEQTFAEHFAKGESDEVVVFPALGKGTTLISPKPTYEATIYSDLASFLRSASESQSTALWQAVGHAMSDHISDEPLWLSTAGGGVAWLHVRLDRRPKYYGYEPYTNWDIEDAVGV